jgi:hypothetical protein
MFDDSALAAIGLLAMGSTAAAALAAAAVPPAPLPPAAADASSELPSRSATNWPGT